MRNIRRIISIFAVIAMLAGIIPVHADDPAVDETKLRRTAYVHAQQTDKPTGDSAVEEYKLGDRTDVYFALDRANKGGADEPQYDLNAYLIKFYFDTSFFDLLDRNGNVITDLTKVTSPIDYTTAFSGQGGDGSVDTDEGLGGEGKPENIHDGIFQIYDQGLTLNAKEENGTTYAAAYLTCLLRGESYPDTPADQEWQNICRLPLKPKTTGSSRVFIELMDTTDEGHGLRLLPKHVKGYPQEMSIDYLNNCSVTINVTQRTRPLPPLPDPVPGKYTSTQYVKLTTDEQGDEVKIWYTTDPSAPLTPGDPAYRLYEGTTGIPVVTDTGIKCYVERTISGVTAYSDVAQYDYFIVPQSPTIFLSTESGYIASPNFYSAKEVFDAYISDMNPYGPIDNTHEVYYTFSNASVEEITPEGGTDPYTGWVKVRKDDPKFRVDRALDVRAVTALMSESGTISKLSDAASYRFRIEPADVVVDPLPEKPQKRVKVELSCPTEGAKIYYTLDGSDPRGGNALLYDGTPLDITGDTVLRVVSEKDGVYGNVGTYEYDFEPTGYDVHAFSAPGTYEDGVDVTLYGDDPDDVIYYTTDGSEPNENSPKFKPGDKLHFDEDTTVRAFVKKADGTTGEIFDFPYRIRPGAPLIMPKSCEFEDSGTVYITKPSGTDSEVYYTLDGSDPATSETRKKLNGNGESVTITEDTTVRAVAFRNGEYSKIAEESYIVVHNKTAKPAVTMPEGIYIAPNMVESRYTTSFLLPTRADVKIYYTIGTTADGTYYPPDPALNDPTGATKVWDGEEIVVKGETMIKAFAVDPAGNMSDLGVYYYKVIPEAPVLSRYIVEGLPAMIPVTGIPNSSMTYTLTVGGETVTNTVELTDPTYYIDAETGKAYADSGKTVELPTKNTFAVPRVYKEGEVLNVSAYTTLDGVDGGVSAVDITVLEPGSPVPPTANYISGTYAEVVLDGAEDDALMQVTLSAPSSDMTIEYSIDGGEWRTYSAETPIRVYDDTTIYTRTTKNGKTSDMAVYIYRFIPLAPIITPASQTFTGELQARISLDPRVPKNGRHTIYYRRSGDAGDSVYSTNPYADTPLITVNSTQAIYAYVVRDDLTANSKRSSTAAAVYTLSAELLTPELNLPHVDEFGKVVYYTEGQELSFIEKYPDRDDIILYYTTDGSDPMTSETRKAWNGEKIILTDEMTVIKAAYAQKCGVCEGCESGGECQNLVYGKTGAYTYYIKKAEPQPTAEPTTEPTPEPSGAPTPTKRPSGGGGGGGGFSNSGFGTGSTPVPGVTAEPPVQASAEPVSPLLTDWFGRTEEIHEKYIIGYPDGSVRPEGSITREEMSAIIYRVMPESMRMSASASYPDVESGRWSEEYIGALSAMGIIEGYPDGKFRPDQPITRAEAAKMTAYWLDLKPGGTVFEDARSSWAADSISAVQSAGLINGYEDGTFRPDREMTRAETATVFNKILGRAPSAEYLKTRPDLNVFNDLSDDMWYYPQIIEASTTHAYTLTDYRLETNLETK